MFRGVALVALGTGGVPVALDWHSLGTGTRGSRRRPTRRSYNLLRGRGVYSSTATLRGSDTAIQQPPALRRNGDRARRTVRAERSEAQTRAAVYKYSNQSPVI